jgi:DNA-binding LacI/PurR family transcriptional regulator
MHYLESELAARSFNLIWHIGAKWTAGVTHPAENLAPDVVLAYVDRSVPALQDFLRQFDVPILSLINPPVLQEAGRAQVAYLAERGKRRIVFAADEVAVAVLAALSDAGVSIPESIAVIGCDDIPLAQLSIPPLTTISWNNRKFLDLLIENTVAASKREKLGSPAMVPLSVVTREST